jgi:acetyl esterase/lipase
MKGKKSILAFLVLLFVSGSILKANEIVPDRKELYKVINGDSLYLHVFQPKQTRKPTAVIVFFFGGGWSGGTPKQFYQQSEYLSSRGIMSICAEYRIKSKHGVSPFDCVEDAKSALRWVRQNAEYLHINPNEIVASGGSAGGHIAICTALIDPLDNPNEDLSISSVPNAVIGFNPVFDTTDKGCGSDRVKGRETEISPCHQVKRNMPPMLNFHGTKDKTVPFENAERFTRLMQEAGNDCKLIAFENEGHGFFNGNEYKKRNSNENFNRCMYETDVFLRNLKYIKGKPTINK